MALIEALERAGTWVKENPGTYALTFFGTVAILVYVGLGNYGVI